MKRLPLLGVLTVYLFLLGCADANQALVSGNIAVTATSPSSQMHLQERNSEKDLVISDDSRRWLLRYARGLCDGETEELPTVPDDVKGVTAPVIVVYYDESGVRRSSQRLDVQDQPLHEKLAQNLSNVCATGADGYLHLLVVSYIARLPNFGISGLFDNKVYEPQVTGIAYELDGERVELDPLEALELNLGPKGARTELAHRLGIDPKTMPENNDLLIEMYRVIHFGEAYPTRNFTDFHRGHSMFSTEQLTSELLHERIALIGDWYKNNVREGQVTYEYSISQLEYRDYKRTMVRSTMATWVLNRLAYYLDDEKLKRLGAIAIDYYLDTYFDIAESLRKGEIVPSGVTLDNGDQVTNRYTSASFLAAAILERDDYQDQLREAEMLMEWAMSFKREDGLMWTQYAQSQYFMPGQLLLACAYMYEKTGDEMYRTFFQDVWGVYEAPLYATMHLGNELYIPYAPAWFTQPLSKMYQLTGQDEYRDMVYEINDRVVRLYEHNSEHQVYYDYDGVLSPKLGYWGNNSITSAHLESLVDAAVVAELDGDWARLAAYKKVIPHTVAFLLRLQYIPENTYYVLHRDRIIGGFKKDLVNSVLWMDNVWHLTSAFMKIQDNDLLN